MKKSLLYSASILAVVAIGLLLVLQARPQPGPSSEKEKSPQKAKITWSKEKIEVTLSPGENASRSVTFTSSIRLKNEHDEDNEDDRDDRSGKEDHSIVVEATPEIAQFIVIQPRTFTSIPAGQPQAVRISFFIPAGTTLGTYQGTIHVRRGKKTLEETLKVVLNVWPEVTKAEFGFSFRYPPAFVVKQTEPSPDSGFYVHEPNEEYPGGGITITTASGDLLNVLSDLNSTMVLLSDTTEIFNGISWRITVHKEQETSLEFRTALAQGSGTVFIVSSTNNSQTLPTFMSILQNFSF